MANIKEKTAHPVQSSEGTRRESIPPVNSKHNLPTSDKNLPPTASEKLSHLKEFSDSHKLDPNLPFEELAEVDEILKSGNAEKGIEIEQTLLEDDSPYPEVRDAVRNYDEDLPANTVRAWTIGLLLTTIGSGVNCLFSLRNPSIAITTFAIQLISYPLGRGWDLIMPDRQFQIGRLKFNLRPGKFNFKEHTIIVCMANAAYAGSAIYATDVLISQQVYYKQNFGWAFQLLFAITNQMTGYGLAGICRRWLVWPASMIWPSNLVNCTLMYTLHENNASNNPEANGWSLTRYRWFLYVMCGSFLWYFFPGWIFQGLSYFTFACWIAPQNVTVNQLFGGLTGLGLIPITFDWTVITGYLASPLIPPWHAIMNTLIGLAIFTIIPALGIQFTGAWYSNYFPMQTSQSYDNTGKRYNVSRILNTDFQFDEAAYKSYSPIFLSTNFALSYGISFAAISAVIIHTALYETKNIWHQFRRARDQQDDCHMRLMKKYTDAPDWWYLVLFSIMLVLSFVVILVWDTHFTWWAMIVCTIIPCIFVIPLGIIYATTNIQIGLNVLTEFIIGYMSPGKPLAMMMFKSYGYIVMVQAQYFLQDLKLGHYLKLPPKTLFAAQATATIWGSIIQIAVLNWALGNIEGICTLDQKSSYTCPGGNVFFTASVIWGAIGPARVFSLGAIYSSLLWYFLIGATLPFLTYFATRRWPKSFFRYLSVPVMLGGLGSIPPATGYNVLCWGGVGLFFQKYLRSHYRSWWKKYNYITSAGLDCGLILCTLFIFFTLSLTNVTPPQWFGNVDIYKTMDQTNTAIRKTLGPGEKIGPTTWL
ncbi:Sexual differentiation process protein isp4 [Golovinomyces cichoracearum]|uniref:Sexual differentiation process protein isp4 n=1 Tax=Golovinomyces cichoracearum TaxID=62708 RepID=A0A420H8E3_9PEZI|nr:Sexual differentiation process protein isp4 [Golovinomyces cichoracearum]